MSILLGIYTNAAGSKAAQTLLQVLAHLIHMNCISERFYKGPSDQNGNLNKKFASRRELCMLHLYMDFQKKNAIAMCVNHIGHI